MLSIRTNSIALVATTAFNAASKDGEISQTRLSTGYRINSAMDDAAGLQIATRLDMQTHGLAVAQRNMQNNISLFQVAEGAADGIIAVASRMKDLAIQAADGASTGTDKAALQEEFSQLFRQYWNLLGTRYNGEDLFIITAPNYNAKFYSPLQLQIGPSSSDTMTVNLLPQMLDTLGALPYDTTTLQTALTQNAGQAIQAADITIDKWSAARSAFGAAANGLTHAFNNSVNISTNTQNAKGRIRDTDYAVETANAARAQMLMQASGAMIKQSNSVTSLVLSLVQ